MVCLCTLKPITCNCTSTIDLIKQVILLKNRPELYNNVYPPLDEEEKKNVAILNTCIYKINV